MSYDFGTVSLCPRCSQTIKKSDYYFCHEHDAMERCWFCSNVNCTWASETWTDDMKAPTAEDAIRNDTPTLNGDDDMPPGMTLDEMRETCEEGLRGQRIQFMRDFILAARSSGIMIEVPTRDQVRAAADAFDAIQAANEPQQEGADDD